LTVADILPALREFGLPGVALGVLAWVIVKAIPHVKDGIAQDRKNRRADELARRKLEDQIQRRRPRPPELPYEVRRFIFVQYTEHEQ
jgi:hypothetical protein